MLRMSEEDFEDVVADALDSIPPAFDDYLERIIIDIEPVPDADTVRRMRLGDARTLLGLFHGVPLTERHVEAPPPMPNRIIIYQRNIERICRNRRQMVRQIRKTVLHELGHHFGLDEDDLADLGYG